MARIVLVGDLGPGWYVLSHHDTSGFTFGVQVDAFNPTTVESFRDYGSGGGTRFQPVGTYLRQNPAAARSRDWKCPSGGGTTVPGTAPATPQTPPAPQVDRQATPTTAQNARADAPVQEARQVAEDLLGKYPDARAYRVRHDHGSGALSTNEERWRFCEGVLYVFGDRVRFEVSFAKGGEKHDFEYTFAEVEEAKPNRWPIIKYKGFHIKLRAGPNYNFAFPGLDPAQVLAAFPVASGAFARANPAPALSSRGAPSAAATPSAGFVPPAGTLDPGGYLGWLRLNPDFGPKALHLGVDFRKNVGDPVFAIADGEIVLENREVGSYGGVGRPGGAMIIKFRTDTGQSFYGLYGHVENMKAVGPVKKGERVATVGHYYQRDGRDTPHLHFGVYFGEALPEGDKWPWRQYIDDVAANPGWRDPLFALRNLKPGPYENTSSRHSEKFEGIFAFANGNGDALLSAMESDEPTSTETKGLDSAVCDGSNLLQVAFVTHQGGSPDSTGRYFPENFDRLEGKRFRVTRGKAPDGASCLVTQNQRISQEKLIPITRLRANVQFSAPDATGRRMHVSYQPCGQQTESELNRSRKGRRLRFCGEVARLGATMHLMVAEFERRGNDLLAAIAPAGARASPGSDPKVSFVSPFSEISFWGV